MKRKSTDHVDSEGGGCRPKLLMTLEQNVAKSVTFTAKLVNKRDRTVGATHRGGHTACVVSNDVGHKPKQRWWKVVAHSVDDE